MSQQFKIDLRAALLSDTDLSNKIGQKLYSGLAPQQEDFPYITYAIVSGLETYSHGGNEGLHFSRVQFDVFAKTVDEAGSVADALKSAIDSQVAGEVQGSTDFGGAFLSGDTELYDSNIGTYRRSIDFRFNYNNA